MIRACISFLILLPFVVSQSSDISQPILPSNVTDMMNSGVNSTAASSSTPSYTEKEIEFTNVFNDWCTTTPVQWIDKSQDVYHSKIAAGSRFAPSRNEDNNGRISDIHAFVTDRLSTLPNQVAQEALPSIIIENECASVTTPSEKCIFDYAGTPAPFQWALQDSLGKIKPGPKDSSVPSNVMNWEQDDMTVVYVPTSNSPTGATELTKTDPNDIELAEFGTRGNSSRKAPKKQFKLNLPDKERLIPGGAKAKRWILYASLFDKTYIENTVFFEMYRKMGQLQKDFSDTWPVEGSVEDLAARAWAPRSQFVNVIFQGRYAGIFVLLDRVEERDGRVWLPDNPSSSSSDDGGEDAAAVAAMQARNAIGDDIPEGNYLLGLDKSEEYKREFLNPMRPFRPDKEENEMIPPNYPEGAHEKLPGTFRDAQVWSIDDPDDATFANVNTDPDIGALQNFILQLYKLLEDPIGNEEILTQRIDMHSMARYFLAGEFAREGDEYISSMFFKVVEGKLYHASPWDYAGTSFPELTCSDKTAKHRYTRFVDRETGTFGDTVNCDESTGNMYTEGWHVNTIYWWSNSMCFLGNCDTGKPIVSDDRWFFGQIFRMPALQSEFWKLWDIVVEHGLVSQHSSRTDGVGDRFSTDLLVDQIFQPIRESVQADRSIWYGAMGLVGALTETPFSPPDSFDADLCESTLVEVLHTSSNNSQSSSSSSDPYLIPAQSWAFHQAEISGRITNFFYETPGLGEEYMDMLSSDEILAKKKEFMKLRLDWMASQHPNPPAENEPDSSEQLYSASSHFAVINTSWLFCVGFVFNLMMLWI